MRKSVDWKPAKHWCRRTMLAQTCFWKRLGERREMMKLLTDQGMAPATARKDRAPVDWESVERDYRAGMLSVREIARHAGVDEKAIRKRAKAKGWERDLSGKVRDRVRTALVRNEVRNEVRTEDDLRTEEEIVDAAAAQVIALVREHRNDIRAQRATADALRQ